MAGGDKDQETAGGAPAPKKKGKATVETLG
jgi:hypothetical protein